MRSIALSVRGLALVLLLASFAQAEGRRPNIVWLIVDDLGYGELGCQGNEQIPTPHIDSIAKSGIRFTSGYVTASYCSPSRAGLMTGRYQTRFGHEMNPTGKHNLDPKAGLPLSEATIADALQEVGYSTGLVGKWHLGDTKQHHPQQRGFDEFFGFLHEGHFFVPPPYDGVTSFLRRKNLPPEATGKRWVDGKTIYSSHMGHNEPPYDENNPLLRGTQEIEEPAYLTDAFTREAVNFIDRHQQEPFFLCVAYNAVHSPLQGADAYMERFAGIEDIHRRVFAAMLSNLDDSVGAILSKLRECNLEEDTLVVFISDNGGPTKELTSSNAPLRGGKGTLYEGGIRLPFLMCWKGQLPAGKEYHAPVIGTDLFATSLAAAGVKEIRELPERVNLLPYLRGQTDAKPHETLYWRMGDRSALRHQDWKIVRHRSKQDSAWELYHLAEDLSETTDLSKSQPKIRQQLITRWKELNSEMVPPVWTR